MDAVASTRDLDTVELAQEAPGVATYALYRSPRKKTDIASRADSASSSSTDLAAEVAWEPSPKPRGVHALFARRRAAPKDSGSAASGITESGNADGGAQ